MRIAGLQKMTLLDFPGKVACTVFLPGCNFRCPFCHNGGLVEGDSPDSMDEEELLAFLNKRRGLLDGVCFTGGEPTLQPGLGDLMRRIRDLGFQIKLDTNGALPERLKGLVQEGLVDYVAMDLKNCPRHYPLTAGIDEKLFVGVEESVRFLMSEAVDYEFRTTVVAEFHDDEAIGEMANWILKISGGKQAKRLFLQKFVDRDSVLQSGLHAPQEDEIARWQEILRPCTQYIGVRGMD